MLPLFKGDPPFPSLSSFSNNLSVAKTVKTTEVPEEGTVSAYAFDAPWQLEALEKTMGSSGDLSKGWERFFFLKRGRCGGISKAKNSWQ